MKSWMQRVGVQVKKIKSDPETMRTIMTDKRRKDTIFAQILSSDLPESELSDQRLIDEGVLIATAGSETTAWAITIATYHIMRNPSVLAKMREESATVDIPEGDTVAPWTSLEKLPYLTAVIKEGVRMAGGMLSRLPRICDKPIQYKEWTIPAGTPVAMTLTWCSSTRTCFRSHVSSSRRGGWTRRPRGARRPDWTSISWRLGRGRGIVSECISRMRSCT
jgi:cytochrome P450